MYGTPLNRRSALALFTAGVVSAAMDHWSPEAFAATAPTRPWLATPEQVGDEQLYLEVIKDPQVAGIKSRLKSEIAGWPRAQMPDAAATLANAIDQWTNSLIFAEVIKHPWAPGFVWGTDDTSRTWLGHTIEGVGTSGDNPDAIYRTAVVEGGGQYEIFGRWHPSGKPTQLVIETDGGDLARPVNNMATAGGHHDDRSNSMIKDDDFVYLPDGSFRLTVSSEAGKPNHLKIPEKGIAVVGARDMLGDWTQRASSLSIRRLDKVPQKQFGLPELRQLVEADLHDYVTFWAKFPDIWFGGLKPNTHSEPLTRPGGFGFVGGLAFHIEPDEAMIVTLDRGAAKYAGFQINNPWMIAPDARSHQVCLNNSQATPSPDGTYTYVISIADPGVANWLDTVGMRDGIGIFRWQAVPPTMTNANLIRDFRVVKLGDIAAMKNLPKVTPQQRAARVAARAAAYNMRVR
jgi:hypothetical protein